MAKQDSFYQFTGSLGAVTQVNSKTYGPHLRARRGSKKRVALNEGFKKSSRILGKSNIVAKAIKDPLIPHWKGFKEGTTWFRLVSIVKKQLQKNDFLDCDALYEFQFVKRFRFSSIIASTEFASVSADDPSTLNITVRSSCGMKLTRETSDSYELTVIVSFLDEDLHADVQMQSTILPLTTKPPEFVTRWPIPVNTKVALIILRADYFREGKSAGLQSRRGMQIRNVIKFDEAGMIIGDKDAAVRKEFD